MKDFFLYALACILLYHHALVFPVLALGELIEGKLFS
jgi:hypothetical protein